MQYIHEGTSVVGETAPEIFDSGRQASTQSKKRKPSPLVLHHPQKGRRIALMVWVF